MQQDSKAESARENQTRTVPLQSLVAERRIRHSLLHFRLPRATHAEPRVGNLLLSAPSTNVILSLLSQAFAQPIATLVGAVLDALRWQFTSRDTGVSFSTFFELSSATDWLSILTFTVGSGFRNLWGVFR
jgi:hypothetical protein